MTLKTRSIKIEWQQFCDKVISSHAPDVQVREMKLAFYAGVESLFSIYVNEVAKAVDV